MKDTITDANFPRTGDGRVYHLGLRAGEVANRIITVGSPSRALAIASCLDALPKPFTLISERGFHTFTGRYKGVPISIVSIGMGGPNMDFFVREVRESLRGDMVVIRLGSCGALIDLPVGSIVMPRASVAVTRNFDFDFGTGNSHEPPYRISKPVEADPDLRVVLERAIEAARPATSGTANVVGTVNASADSFYSSQGRQTSFPDHNENLIQHLQSSMKDLATLEMETFHLFHLAACYHKTLASCTFPPPPLTTTPVLPTVSPPLPSRPHLDGPVNSEDSIIRAAAVHMVFASRTSQDFITPEQVSELETWAGKGVLDALSGFEIPEDRLQPTQGSVWMLE